MLLGRRLAKEIKGLAFKISNGMVRNSMVDDFEDAKVLAGLDNGFGSSCSAFGEIYGRNSDGLCLLGSHGCRKRHGLRKKRLKI